jgi:SAM-dependent methyltransferase
MDRQERAESMLADTSGRPDRPQPFPLDPTFYRNSYPDLAGFDDQVLFEHYQRHGIDEGRIGCRFGVRDAFIGLVPQDGAALEIGPFNRPVLTGQNVRYADVLDQEQLRARAREIGFDPDGCPTIHYPLPDGSLDRIPDRFDAVLSAHCIEHQPDLVDHLRSVERLLRPQGRYFLIIPDKRYCFDHFLPETSVADVVSAHMRRAKVHDVGSVIEHWALTTHNDCIRHWNGDHGQPAVEQGLDPVRRAIEACTAHPDAYFDVHAWQFTPRSFLRLMDQLAELGLIGLRVQAVYPTLRHHVEFCAILAKQAA